MKNFTFLFFLLLGFSVYAQFGPCRCNDLFDRDIRVKDNRFSRQDAKSKIYEYLLASTDKRKEMQQELNIGSTTTSIINSIPVINEFSLSGSDKKNSLEKIYKKTITDQYLSDENLNILIKSYVPNIAFPSYDTCIEGCNIYAEINSFGGIRLRNISQTENLIVLELKYTSNPSGGKITIDNATYSNGNVIGIKQFNNGRVIQDRQIIYEQIRLQPEDGITVTISFQEPGVGNATFSIKSGSINRKSTDTPMGTIVSSLLNYNQFLELNGLKFQSDINKVIWVPCDGRNIGTAKGTYGAYLGGVVPDLRGVFIRGANNMGNLDASVPNANPENLNPDNTNVGQIQLDAIRNIKGSFLGSNPNQTGDEKLFVTTPIAVGDENKWGNNSGVEFTFDASKADGVNVSTENRPKNMTVYYYIKIR